jgi:hypothetical protein
MTRIGLAIAAAALALAALVGTSQATPVAPLPQSISADHSNVTQVWWRNRWGRRCWRGRWGRIHCR